jgi:DNA-binding PadR family transcriptional regulator
MARIIQITELEGAVLATVWRDGPCSPYAVMREFGESPTPDWAASAGSIYPLIARLEAKGLVTAEIEKWGKRTKKSLRVTEEGARAVREWVAEIRNKAAELSIDPVRTRLHFVESLEAGDERRILEEAEHSARALVARLSVKLRAEIASEPLEALPTEGALYAAKARLAWLRAIRARLEKGSGRAAAG